MGGMWHCAMGLDWLMGRRCAQDEGDFAFTGIG